MKKTFIATCLTCAMCFCLAIYGGIKLDELENAIYNRGEVELDQNYEFYFDDDGLGGGIILTEPVEIDDDYEFKIDEKLLKEIETEMDVEQDFDDRTIRTYGTDDGMVFPPDIGGDTIYIPTDPIDNTPDEAALELAQNFRNEWNSRTAGMYEDYNRETALIENRWNNIANAYDDNETYILRVENGEYVYGTGADVKLELEQERIAEIRALDEQFNAELDAVTDELLHEYNLTEWPELPEE